MLNIKPTPKASEAAPQAAGQTFKIWYDARVHTDELALDDDGDILIRPVRFRLRSHHRDFSDGRITEMLGVLAASSPHTVQELDGLYWAILQTRRPSLAHRVWSDVRRQRDFEGRLRRAAEVHQAVGMISPPESTLPKG